MLNSNTQEVYMFKEVRHGILIPSHEQRSKNNQFLQQNTLFFDKNLLTCPCPRFSALLCLPPTYARPFKNYYLHKNTKRVGKVNGAIATGHVDCLPSLLRGC
ncbi:hypothetical protein TNIN_384941 [Trichonephila inaurata madagascariensis]|uniref:Uncharacterized protein n=1 Tax=Trichonephila inaurata madagascariensis TaxID=2747483 RepID=A0A8X6YDF4_9ARAC|nr:hypothetical protein TNIN_384941 [Trichonephila inaurata madagascariensis]